MIISIVPSPYLHHGPSAQTKASLSASSWGRIVGNFSHPVEGLNVAVVREASEIMGSPSMGDGNTSVVLGPVDVLTSSGITDVLLKTLEEVDERCPRVFLWARDLGGVRPTIKSRCLLSWSPGIEMESPDLRRSCDDILAAYSSKSTSGVLYAARAIREAWASDAEAVLRALAASVARLPLESRVTAWAALRPVLSRRKPTVDEVIVRFLPR